MKQRTPTPCPIVFALDLFGDKWSLVILRDILLDNKCHFSELLASNEKIARNILSDRLEALVRNDFLTKEKDPANKSAIIYKPTPKALGLLPVLFALIHWGVEHNPNYDEHDEVVREILTDPLGLHARTIEKFSK